MLDPPGEQKVGLPVHFVEGNAAFCRQNLERSIDIFDGNSFPERENMAFNNRGAGISTARIVRLCD